METVMAGRTISAYVDENVAARVAALAEREDRPPAQIAGHAIRFYTSLSSDARNAIRTVEKAGSPDEMRWVMNEVMRVLFRAEMKVVQREMAAEMGEDRINAATEAEIEDLASDWDR
jgi:predicted transcriptional regulator